MLSGGWGLGIVVLVVFLLFTDKGTVSATDVKAADCLKDLPASGLVITVNKYSPSAAAHPEVGLFVLYPSEDSWGQGDRTVTCIATTIAPCTGRLSR